MIFIENEGCNDPRINLALEEYVARNFPAQNDYLLFYINQPSIIIGKNQVTIEEVNQKYIEDNNIYVVRRISGGGAVYHDLGNLNFSFITNHDIKKLHNFKQFTKPVIDALTNLGLDAELIGRNDILIEGKKISGTAQFSNSRRMISHGTLLLDSDLDEVNNALQVKISKLESKGHKSVRSRVANINDFLKKRLTMDEFREMLLQGLFEGEPNFEKYHLTAEEWNGVYALRDSKYDTWDWNYGRSPKFNIQRTKRYPVGIIDARIFVEKGRIETLHIFGDFFGQYPVEQLNEKLKGVPYDKFSIQAALKDVNIQDYFGALDKEDFVQLLYGEDE
ncbi:MAG: lipoate--protein ligase [Brumimicrobium sp.]|nr:lipoate--protein ligase [Brumimicrobium sp.]MCO5267721.1 lipoate--protein ligase [Brumimicrobium sp.]